MAAVNGETQILLVTRVTRRRRLGQCPPETRNSAGEDTASHAALSPCPWLCGGSSRSGTPKPPCHSGGFGFRSDGPREEAASRLLLTKTRAQPEGKKPGLSFSPRLGAGGNQARGSPENCSLGMHGSTPQGSASASPSPDRERPGLVVRGEHPVPVGCSFARRLRHSRGKGELRAARLLRCGPRLPLAARPIIQPRLARTGATADHGGKQRRPIRLDRGYQPVDYRVPLRGERESGDHFLCRLECLYLLRERPHESAPATLTRRPNGSALPGGHEL